MEKLRYLLEHHCDKLERIVAEVIRISDNSGLAADVVARALENTQEGETPIDALKESLHYWEICNLID